MLRHAVTGRRPFLFGPSVYHGALDQRRIALTFDDGPSPSTAILGRYLESQGILATFFVCGVNVLRHPEIARALVAVGHELGNHTYSHARLCPRIGWRMNLLSRRTVAQEVQLAQQAIQTTTGYTPTLFRAPYGLHWFGLGSVLRRLGLLDIMWTVIGHDWEWPAAAVVRHTLAHAVPGGIICLHDGRDTRLHPDIAVTLQAVEKIVPLLREQGFSFCTVSELLGRS